LAGIQTRITLLNIKKCFIRANYIFTTVVSQKHIYIVKYCLFKILTAHDVSELFEYQINGSMLIVSSV